MRMLIKYRIITGHCKTWTLDSGLDHGLDYGLDCGLEYELISAFGTQGGPRIKGVSLP
jgi:hypothetical protein